MMTCKLSSSFISLVLTLSYVVFRSNTVFGYTEPGAGKKKFECQDTYSIIDLPEDHMRYYAVYDGHGNVGRQVITKSSSINRMHTLGFSLGKGIC
jgi:hypothetical protein